MNFPVLVVEKFHMSLYLYLWIRLHAATKKILLMWDRVARCNGLVLLCGIGLCVATDINSTIWDRFVRRNNIIYFWIGIFSTMKEICFVFTFVYRVVRHNREDMFCIFHILVDRILRRNGEDVL